MRVSQSQFIAVIALSAIFGGVAGGLAGFFVPLVLSDADGRNAIEVVQEAIGQQESPSIDRADQDVVAVVERVLPSVVSIDIVQNMEEEATFRSGFPIGPVSIGGGTGFFISEDGLVVTNRHVISDEGASYVVITQDGEEYPATVLGLDPAMDLGVLKVESSTDREGKPFPALELGDSDLLKPGQTVIAIGNALAEFQNSVTKGIVSGLNRNLVAGEFGREELIEEAIQTDAAINPGNSGGPLLTLDGKVVGMNTAITDGAQSLGFALPSNALFRAVESVRKYGRIVRPWIGVRYVPVDEEVAESEELPADYGAFVLGSRNDPGVMPNSPAEKAGLRERDLILEINGERIGVQRSLAAIVARLLPGETVTLKVWRDQSELQIPLILEERPQN